MVCMSEVHMFKNTWLLLSPGLKCQTIGQDCSGAQMTINGRSRVTSVRWVFVAIILTLPASEQSIWWPFDFYIFISIYLFCVSSGRCADNGCAKQFGGFGSCVNLAAPIQINALAQRFRKLLMGLNLFSLSLDLIWLPPL